MSQELLIAEDDPKAAAILREYLERLGVIVRPRAAPMLPGSGSRKAADQRSSMGSVLGHMGIPLRMLPTTRVIIWSGDAGLVREAQQLGLGAF